MAKYTLIASRDPFASSDVETLYRWARELQEAGHSVTLFLVQNAVLQARQGCDEILGELAAAGVTICADDFSLTMRGISKEHLAESVQASKLDLIVDHMAERHKVIWH